MICNDLVQISLGPDCQAEVLPDMILEGNGCPNGNFQVQARVNNVWVPANGNFVATSAHINLTLQVRVRDLNSGNMCWGNIKIEDKLAPVLDCSEIFLNCAITTYTPDYLLNTLNISEAYPAVDENCSSVTLTHIDTWFDLPCGGSINGYGNISAYVLRKWTAVDASGNSATCNQYIYFERKNGPDVIFPPDVTVDCTNPVTAPSATGAPYISQFGFEWPIWPNNTFCEMNATYNDLRLPICDGSYKILRTWTVLSWCLPNGQSNPRTHVQLIKVADNEGPVFDCPADVTVSTDPNVCKVNYDLPDMIVTDNCSRLNSFEAQWQDHNGIWQSRYGSFSNFPGNNKWDPDTLAVMGHANNLGVGVNQIKYILKDDCGNTTVCYFNVTVMDLVPPSVSCDQTTTVAIGVNDPFDCYEPTEACKFGGVTWVKATTFDDGSYDNCHGLKFKVRRMAPYSACIEGLSKTPCYPNGMSEYDLATAELDSIKFYCCEVGTTQTVVLTAYQIDWNGNIMLDPDGEPIYNECMIQVEVQDKQNPTCVPPANVTVNCEAFDPSLWAYGKAQVSDNCCLDETRVYQGQCGLTHSASYTQFDTVCNKGTIVRTFRAFDCRGFSSQCTQRIVVTYNQDYYIKFPDDQYVTFCNGTGIYDEPKFFGKDCELLGVSYQDEIFTVVTDACFKIERTWQIINWCTYNPNLPCINVPNPEPNSITHHPSNRPGPTVSACGTLAPWAPTSVRINSSDPNPTNFCTFWDKNANCYRYKQIIKIVDGQAPTGTFVQPTCANQTWNTANNPQLWNEMYWWDNTIQSHDLCEEPTELCITATDACSGSNVNIEYLLFLDLDGDGVMETVINSIKTGIAGLGWNAVPYNNINTPNYSGGTIRQFDGRPVPNNQKWGFAIQETVSGTNKTACVRFNTQQQQNTFVAPQLPHGTHKIKWNITDGCGNNKEYEYTFTVRDCKPPTVVCLNGLSVNIMPTGMITLWASDFLQYTEDNCTPSNQIKIGIRKCGEGTGFPVDAFGNPVTSVNFTCAELGSQCVELWAIDAAGNADYCSTYIIVQDNIGSCSGQLKPVVAGLLKTELNEGVEEANVWLSGTAPNGIPLVPTSQLTQNSGSYMFIDALPVGSSYVVAPEKDDNPLNGVTTYDLVLISKHILGIEPFDSPYKMIAADANKSGSITTFDIVELRKLILGIYSELPNNTSWRFVDKKFVFPNQNNPFQTSFPETISAVDMQVANLNDDFIGVKVGDVNNTAISNSLAVSDDRSAGLAYFDADEQQLTAGDVFEVKFRTSEKMMGYQFTLNHEGLELLEIMPGENMGKDNFAPFANALTASVNTEATEFSFRFRAVRAGSLSEMLRLSNSITRTEGYSNMDGEVEQKNLALRFHNANGSTLVGTGFELLQNTPNPTRGFTTISFHLPEACEATLTISNAEGRVIKRIKSDYAKGLNTVTLQRSDLENGILFYQLDTPTHSATKKMIVAE
jgi:hypothetical protein